MMAFLSGLFISTLYLLLENIFPKNISNAYNVAIKIEKMTQTKIVKLFKAFIKANFAAFLFYLATTTNKVYSMDPLFGN